MLLALCELFKYFTGMMFIVMNSRIILEQGNNVGCMSSIKCGGSQTRVYQAIIESLL